MQMARVILFTGQMEAMSMFYGEVLGLKQVSKEKGWLEFAAGGANIALHSGPARRQAKRVRRSCSTPKTLRPCAKRWWHAAQRSARCGRGDVFCLCDGKDPDGNPIQLSNR